VLGHGGGVLGGVSITIIAEAGARVFDWPESAACRCFERTPATRIALC
jgi:hypothetical protein